MLHTSILHDTTLHYETIHRICLLKHKHLYNYISDYISACIPQHNNTRGMLQHAAICDTLAYVWNLLLCYTHEPIYTK